MLKALIWLLYSLSVDTHIKLTANEFGINLGVAKNNFNNASSFYNDVLCFCIINKIDAPKGFRELQNWKIDVWREWRWALDPEIHSETRMHYFSNVRIALGPAELANSYWQRRILPSVSALSTP